MGVFHPFGYICIDLMAPVILAGCPTDTGLHGPSCQRAAAQDKAVCVPYFYISIRTGLRIPTDLFHSSNAHFMYGLAGKK